MLQASISFGQGGDVGKFTPVELHLSSQPFESPARRGGSSCYGPDSASLLERNAAQLRLGDLMDGIRQYAELCNCMAVICLDPELVSAPVESASELLIRSTSQSPASSMGPV